MSSTLTVSEETGKCQSQNPFPVEQRVVTVLLVSPLDEDHQGLRQILQHSKWQQYGARTAAEALAFLEEHPTPVAICESELPDGTWQDVLAQMGRLKRPPMLVVTARLADDVLWSQVLNLGGYNVLAKPLDAAEVFHVVSFAWLCWKSQWNGRGMAARSAAG